jgi:hypothetical protein
MTATVATIFAVVYLGMILGGLPFLQLDRTGVALLGAIALVGLEVLTPEQAALSIHLPTLLLLFSFMVISAQMRLGRSRHPRCSRRPWRRLRRSRRSSATTSSASPWLRCSPTPACGAGWTRCLISSRSRALPTSGRRRR